MKLVYVGLGLSGRTTNMHYVFERTEPERRTKMVSTVHESGSRDLSFSLTPRTLASPVADHALRFELCANPGAVWDPAGRRALLHDVDGVIFIVDSQEERFEAAQEQRDELIAHLASHGRKLDDVAFVIAYNKRDLPNVRPIEDLQRALNPTEAPHFEMIARQGVAVFDALKACANQMLQRAPTH